MTRLKISGICSALDDGCTLAGGQRLHDNLCRVPAELAEIAQGKEHGVSAREDLWPQHLLVGADAHKLLRRATVRRYAQNSVQPVVEHNPVLTPGDTGWISGSCNRRGRTAAE